MNQRMSGLTPSRPPAGTLGQASRGECGIGYHPARVGGDLTRLARNVSILALLLLLVGSSISAGGAAAATIPGCANPADSALNQYCETIPGSSGPHHPQAGAPAVARTLPASTLRRLETAIAQTQNRVARHARRKLLSLPAPTVHHPLPVRQAHISTGSPIPWWLIALLIALAVAMTGLAVARWRRRGSGEA